MLINREIILVELETTYNTDPTPTGAANAVLVESPSWSHEGARMVERSNVKGSLAKDQQIFAGTLKQVTFDVELKGSGAAGTAPEIGPLLQACGMSETVSAGVSVTYEPESSDHESVTIYYYQDGILHAITGARGNVSFSGEAGGIGKWSFTFTGHDAGVSDASLPTPTYDTTVPPALIGVTFSVGGYAAVINAFQFDMANGLAMPSNITAADGYGEIIITGRDVAGSFDPEAVLVATNPYIADWKTGEVMAMTVGPIGGTAGNRCTFTLGDVYYREVAPGDREGLRTFDISFGAVESASGADDEISIVFT